MSEGAGRVLIGVGATVRLVEQGAVWVWSHERLLWKPSMPRIKVEDAYEGGGRVLSEMDARQVMGLDPSAPIPAPNLEDAYYVNESWADRITPTVFATLPDYIKEAIRLAGNEPVEPPQSSDTTS